jgi:hypothetical protein
MSMKPSPRETQLMHPKPQRTALTHDDVRRRRAATLIGSDGRCERERHEVPAPPWRSGRLEDILSDDRASSNPGVWAHLPRTPPFTPDLANSQTVA